MDYDIIFLGIYYMIVILGYLIFEMIPINYRPILIEGVLEASYPSSTTLLVTCVMPTAAIQLNDRIKCGMLRRVTVIFIAAFTAFMVIGRILSGVHWISDIIGALTFSIGLVSIYDAVCNIENDFKREK